MGDINGTVKVCISLQVHKFLSGMRDVPQTSFQRDKIVNKNCMTNVLYHNARQQFYQIFSISASLKMNSVLTAPSFDFGEAISSQNISKQLLTFIGCQK